MFALTLLDVAGPSEVIGIGVLIVLVISVLAFSAVLIGGFVFLLWRKRRKPSATVGAAGHVPQ